MEYAYFVHLYFWIKKSWQTKQLTWLKGDWITTQIIFYLSYSFEKCRYDSLIETISIFDQIETA